MDPNFEFVEGSLSDAFTNRHYGTCSLGGLLHVEYKLPHVSPSPQSGTPGPVFSLAGYSLSIYSHSLAFA